MNSIQALTEFLREHHVMTLSTSSENIPHSTPLFYAFDSQKMALIFTSEAHTRHMKEISQNKNISAGIYLETEEIGQIQGAQIWGIAETDSSSEIREFYFKRFPMTRAFLLTQPKHEFCVIKINQARLIHNKLGFGKKLEWSLNV